MYLGFIGTGEITKAVIHGILKSKINFKRIYISRRNNKNSNYLKSISKKITILNNNRYIHKFDNSNYLPLFFINLPLHLNINI